MKNKILSIICVLTFAACANPTVTPDPVASSSTNGTGTVNGNVNGSVALPPAYYNGGVLITPNADGTVTAMDGTILPNPYANNSGVIVANPSAVPTSNGSVLSTSTTPVPNASASAGVSTYVTPVPLATSSSTVSTAPTSAFQTTAPLTSGSNSTPLPQSTFAPSGSTF